jgi:hypothetical protein
VILILLLGICTLMVCPYLMFYFAIARGETVAQSQAPGGGLTMSVVKRSFLASCYSVDARGAWDLFSEGIGEAICDDYHLALPFDASRQRFEWFEDRGMVALTADGARTQPNGQPYNLYIRLFRYDDAGNVSELSRDDLRAHPKDSPIEGPDYAWRDRRIRALLGLTTPASPDAAYTPAPTITPNGGGP